MRYLRIFVLCIFVMSLGFFAWVNMRYYSSMNTDIPVITADTDFLVINASDGKEALLRGLQAQDATDGDLTDQIIVASVSHFIEPKTVNVKYVVFDSANHFATLTRRVCFADYESPRFSMNVPPVIRRSQNFNLLDNVKVTDCLDGDISGKIRVITNMLNIYAAGVYPVTLEVTNSCGDLSQLTLWVTVLDKENTAVIELNEYVVYVDCGGYFDPYGYISQVTNSHGSVLPVDMVQVSGSPDMTTPGTYRLEYHYDDQQYKGQTAMIVVVQSGEGTS